MGSNPSTMGKIHKNHRPGGSNKKVSRPDGLKLKRTGDEALNDLVGGDWNMCYFPFH